MPPTRDAAVTTSFGDVFRLVSFVGRDALSEPFAYQLEVTATEPLQPQALLGEVVAVVLFDTAAGPRFFQGHVTAATYAGIHRDVPRWRLDVGPWLAFLRHRVNCRHFVDQDAVTILETVFKDYGPLATYENRCRERPPKREYTCQFNEDDFSFVRRLLEREGIYFYFEHGENEHTLILDDDSTLAEPAAGYETVPFRGIEPGRGDAFEGEHLSSWTPTASLKAGRWVTRNFDFKNPRDLLEGQRADGFDHRVGEIEVYSYPDLHLADGEGNSRAQRRLEAAQADARIARGEGNVRGLRAGCRFTLEGVEEATVGGDWLLRALTHVIRVGEARSGDDVAEAVYAVTVEAQPLAQPFRPPQRSAKPTIPGPQTAVVMGPDGEEIHCDEHGRIKLKFHWDRYSESHEDCSPWVRCAEYWASGGFGSFHLPRVGDEVLVTFLDGDPDRPVVTGRVYNGLTSHPYALPGERNRSGVRSHSVGGSGFNEVSYDDTAGEEELFLHAQRDMKNVVKNDSSRSVGNDESVSVGNNRTLEVGNILNEFVEALALINVKAGQASLSLDKDGNGLLNTTTELTTSVGTAASTKMASGGTVTVEANSEITLKVGGSSVTLTTSGITLEASKVEIKAPNIETSGTTLKNEHTSVDLTGSGSVKITGGMVDING